MDIAADSPKTISLNALDRTKRFAETCLNDADTILLVGSVARGEDTSTSDFDIVALYDALPAGAWREMRSFEGRDFEVFAHDLGTLAYFCSEIERPSGRPVLATMVRDGVAVKQRSPDLLERARQLGRETIDGGPPSLTLEEIDGRRYAITDLLQTLSAPRSVEVRMSVGCTLYTMLADFALRTSGKWSAGGKTIPGAIANVGPDLPREFEAAFHALFVDSNTAPVLALADFLLAPYGGRLRSGYKQVAPAAWRTKDEGHTPR